MSKKKIPFENIKIAIVCSSGGHLTHMMMLKPFWEKSCLEKNVYISRFLIE